MESWGVFLPPGFLTETTGFKSSDSVGQERLSLTRDDQVGPVATGEVCEILCVPIVSLEFQMDSCGPVVGSDRAIAAQNIDLQRKQSTPFYY